MGRTRRTKANGDDANADTAAERGKNSELTEDERRALLFQHVSAYQAALAAKKTADANIKNVCKIAKADLGKGAVADIKDIILLREPGGEQELREEIERKLRVARYVNAPAGYQFSFAEDMRPAVDQAFEAGKIQGLDGGDMAPPYDPTLPQYQRWLEGWHAGQEVLSSDFRKKISGDAPPPPDSDELRVAEPA